MLVLLVLFLGCASAILLYLLIMFAIGIIKILWPIIAIILLGMCFDIFLIKFIIKNIKRKS